MSAVISKIAATLSVAAIAGPFCSVAAKPPTPAAPSPFVVFDATGTTIGRFGGFGGAPLLILSTTQVPAVAVQLIPTIESGAENTTKLSVQMSQVWFTTPDCTGTAYTFGGNFFGVPTANVLAVSGVPYVYMPSTRTLVLVNVASTFSSSGCSAANGVRWAAPADAPIPLSSLLTEPLGVR